MSAHKNWPRCYAPPEEWRDDCVHLNKKESHHLANVLRVAKGDDILVFDGAGREVAGRMKSIEPSGKAAIEIVEELPARMPPTRIELVQAIPKKGRMETVLQKATELGVCSIQPILSEHTIVRIKDDKHSRKKIQRWNDILLGAAKQCGVAVIPRLKPIRTFSDYLKERDHSSPMLICSLEDDARPLRDVVAELDPTSQTPLDVLVGPEGDFSEEEYELARAAGAIPVSLGNLVLRTDTAALYILSALRFALSDC